VKFFLNIYILIFSIIFILFIITIIRLHIVSRSQNNLRLSPGVTESQAGWLKKNN